MAQFDNFHKETTVCNKTSAQGYRLVVWNFAKFSENVKSWGNYICRSSIVMAIFEQDFVVPDFVAVGKID